MDSEGLLILNSLEEIYNGFRRIEAKALSVNHTKLSISEWHIIEKVGERHRMRLGDLALACGVKMASMTIAVNKLVAKGCLLRQPMLEDRRGVYILLTRRGQAAYRIHKTFLNRMLSVMLRDMDALQIANLSKTFNTLKKFIAQYE